MIRYQNCNIPAALKKAIKPDGFCRWVFEIHKDRQPITWADAFTLAAQCFVYHFGEDPPISYETFRNKKTKLFGRCHSK